MKHRLFVLLVALMLIVSACGKSVSGTFEPIATEPPSGAEQPQATEPAVAEGGGGTVVFVISEEPAGLNRYLADAAITY